jgi:hypothetical protein
MYLKPTVSQSFRFQLFLCLNKKNWWYTEIVKFHLVVYQQKSFRSPDFSLQRIDVLVPHSYHKGISFQIYEAAFVTAME